MEFQVGDRVMLKVSPWKGVMRFGKRGKLNPRYVGPFKVLEKVGPIAYKFELPQELSRVHNTFYVSNIKKCYADKPLAVPLDGLHFDDKLYFKEEPVEIMDREVKWLKRSRILIFKCMRTRNSYFPNNSSVTIPRHQNKGCASNVVEPELRTIIEIAPMADNRTMEELLQAPTKGITSILKFKDVPNDVIKLRMFPYSLEGATKVWYNKEPPNSILTWDDLVNKFVNQFFPPSKTTHLKIEISRLTQRFEETFGEAWERFKEMIRAGEARIWLDKEPPRSILTWEDLVSKFINQFFSPSKTTYLQNEITNFLQKPNETFNEAWEYFKDLLRQCPHHGFSELHQLDTFYNALNPNDQDALDFAAGGNFLDKIPRECLSIIKSKSKIVASLEDKLDIRMNRFEKSLNDMKNSFITPTAPLKAVEEMRPPGFSQPTHQNNNQNHFQGNNFNQNRQNNQGAIYQNRSQQALNYQAPSQQNTVTNSKFEAYTPANDANMNNLQLKSGMSYKEPPIPPLGMKQQEPIEESTDTELPSTKDIQPPLVQVEVQIDKPIEEPSVVIPKAKANLLYPSRLQKEKL
nr:putative reverse transcriptase domain-containing protein [Tanacetum cinerariifolium]